MDPAALRAARERAGLTQHQLARLVGVAGGERVSRWELGTSEPRPEILVRLAKVLDVAALDLLDVGGWRRPACAEVRSGPLAQRGRGGRLTCPCGRTSAGRADRGLGCPTRLKSRPSPRRSRSARRRFSRRSTARANRDRRATQLLRPCNPMGSVCYLALVPIRQRFWNRAAGRTPSGDRGLLGAECCGRKSCTTSGSRSGSLRVPILTGARPARRSRTGHECSLSPPVGRARFAALPTLLRRHGLPEAAIAKGAPHELV